MKLGIQFSLVSGSVTMLLAFVLGTMAGSLAEGQTQQDIGQDLERLAQTMADQLDQDMFERYREIQIIAELEPLRDRQTSILDQKALLEKLQETYPNYSWIGFANVQGTIQVSTQSLLQGKNVGERPWFLNARDQPYAGDVHDAVLLAQLLPNPSNEPIRFVDVSAPVVNKQGEFMGVLGAHLNWRWATEVKESLLDSSYAHDKELFVLTQDGTVILGSANWDDKAPQLKSIELAQSGQSGYRVERWPDGENYLTGFVQGKGYRDYPGLGWIVLVRQDVASAFAPAQALRQQILLGGMVCGGIFAAVGWLIADRLSNPLLQIAVAAERIRLGQSDIKIPIIPGKDETAQLSQTLNQLVDELMTRERELETTNQQLFSQLDVSRQMSTSLRRSEEQMRQIVDNIQDALILRDAETGNAIYHNSGYERLHHFTTEEILTDPALWMQPIHPQDRDRILQQFHAEFRTRHYFEAEYRIVLPDQSIRWVLDRAFPIRDETEKIYRYVVIKRDISERKQSEEIFKTITEKTAPVVGKDFFSTLVQQLSEALDVEHVLIAEQSDVVSKTLAYWSEGALQHEFTYALENTPCKQVLEQGMYYQASKVSQTFPEKSWLAALEIEGYFGVALTNASGQTLGHLCVLSRRKLDVYSRYGAMLQLFATRAAAELERQRLQEQLKHDTLHDALTGLPNRNLLMERLNLAIERAKRCECFQYAVLFIDLDRFKVINDSLGHLLGDQLLIEISKRLNQIVSSVDLVARLGGDEFVILLENMNEFHESIQVAEQVLSHLRQPICVGGHTVITNASIGIVVATSDYTQSSELLRDADTAMYRAKVNRKASYELFNATMHTQALRLLQLEHELRQALDRQEFSLRYQPIISLSSEALIGFEALVRWEHPIEGTISPAEFIPVAEETGLIVALGKWVIETACRQMARWQTQFPAAANLKVSVNLSALQLREADVVKHICQTLNATGLPGYSLALEITESVLMQDIEDTSRTLAQLQEHGIQISIDDFGTGFSSLNYLYRFPANNLKIDRSFVSHLSDGAKNQQIAATVVSLADQLGMNAIAEGIETRQQLEHLQQLNCELGQGYLFDAPLTAEAATKKIMQNRAADTDIH